MFGRDKSGFVYIMISFHNDYTYACGNGHKMLIKVGRTNRDPRRRAEEIRKNTGIKVELYVSWRVNNAVDIESYAFDVLSLNRAENIRGEFYAVTKDQLESLEREISARARGQAFGNSYIMTVKNE